MELTKDKLIEIVNSEVESVNYGNDTDFELPFTDIGIDSMDMLSILLKVEEYTGIEITNEDVEKLNTLNSIIEYCNK